MYLKIHVFDIKSPNFTERIQLYLLELKIRKWPNWISLWKTKTFLGSEGKIFLSYASGNWMSLNGCGGNGQVLTQIHEHPFFLDTEWDHVSLPLLYLSLAMWLSFSQKKGNRNDMHYCQGWSMKIYHTISSMYISLQADRDGGPQGTLGNIYWRWTTLIHLGAWMTAQKDILPNCSPGR